MRLPFLRISLFTTCLALASACAETDIDPSDCVDPASCPPYTVTDSAVLVPSDSGTSWPEANFPSFDAATGDASLPVGGDAAVNSNDGSISAIDAAAPGDGGVDSGDTGMGDSGTADSGAATSDSGVAPSAGHIRGPAPTKETASNRGTYRVQSYTSGFRNGPAYADATIYYPTDAEPPFAIVAVVPGFVSPQSSIQAWGPFLASHGIVTITIGTNGGGDLPKVRAEALMDALTTLKSEGMRAQSPLSGKIDESRMGVMGWSMGGGGTLWAVTEHPELKAGISLCGWESGPQYQTDKVPSLLLSSTGDTVAPTRSHATPHYNQIPNSTAKMLMQVQGGNHSSANDPANHDKLMGLLGLSWMKVFLEGDERYRPFLKEKPSQAAIYQTTL